MADALQAASRPLLDHIVILVPASVLHNLPTWLSESFVIINGGTHAGGVTENKLIILADGVYIELIAFVDGVDPSKRQEHRWGNRPEGQIIDWALTLPASGIRFGEVRTRVRNAQAGVKYDEPQPGGRVTPRGTEVKWAVSMPEIEEYHSPPSSLSLDAGEAPFWCFDKTPRNLRVPNDTESNIRHPCRAIGVATITLVVADKEALEALKKVYNGIFRTEGAAKSSHSAGGLGYEWPVYTRPVGTVRRLGSFVLRLPTDSEDVGKPGKPGTQIRVSLWSTLKSLEEGKVAGVLHGGWPIEFELCKV